MASLSRLISREMRDDGGRYALTALAREAEAVACAAQGERNDRLNTAAFALGGLIASGHLDRAHVEQRLTEAALNVGLDALEARSTIASGLRAGLRRPRDAPDQVDRQGPALPPMRAAAPRPALPEPEQFAELQPRWRARWAETRSITANDAAGSYLLARGCAFPHPEGDLRWHPALRHPSGHVGPVLVGLVTDARDASLQLNLHLTWIAADGSGTKAAVDRPRRLLWRHPKKGGVIRLWPDCEATLGIGMAEGVETALTLARAFTPVWAAIDAGNLAAFAVLPGIEVLTIAIDHDAAGLKAFKAVAERWHAAGREVRRVLAPSAGADLNDWAYGAARA